VGDEELVLNSGDGLLLLPWEQHVSWRQTDENCSLFWMQFDCEPALVEFQTWTEWTSGLNQDHPGRSQLRTYHSSDTEQLVIPRQFQPIRKYELFGIFEQMVREFNHPADLFRFRLTLLLGQVLELLTSDLLQQKNTETSLPASYLTYRKLVIYLEINYQFEFSKGSLEAQLDRKYEYLCHIFKKYAGMTITAYIQRLRLQRAKHLLHRTQKPISEIAAEVGFNDPLYFSKLFKKIEQMTPTDYRNQR
jgi:AraC-like DNA-binding protein